MESASRAIEDISDDEDFTIEDTTALDKDTTIQRLEEFSYYLTEYIEANLDFFLKLLEGRNVPLKSNSKYVFVLSKLASAVPKVGSGLGGALSETEKFFLNRIDKKNSRTLAELVYYSSDHRKDFRRIIIEAACEIFCSFEDQFRKLSCNGGERRAMQKLAKNAAGRILSYLLEMKIGKNVTKVDIVKGIIQGQSKTETTVKHVETKWKTSKIYVKTGIVTTTGIFYKTKNSHPEKYGHRRNFSWETEEEIEKTYQRDNGPYEIPKYFLMPIEEFFSIVENYIISKNEFEEASFERDNYYQKLSAETKKHHDEIMKEINDNFADILEEMANHVADISCQSETQTVMLEKILYNQEEHKIASANVTNKLDVIHKDLQETQISLTTKTTEIQEDINVIKSNQSKISNNVVNHEDLKIIPSLKNEVKQILKQNDPGPAIKKELERGVKNIGKEVNKSKNKLKKIFS